MQNNYQERIFLNLMGSDKKAVQLAKDILRSPLDLTSKIVKDLFEDRLRELRDFLDEIKQFAAGIRRAEKLSSSYSLASYYSDMFAFHQYFHSSYRARQGKVLERMLQIILKEYGRCDKIPEKSAEMLSILKTIFGVDELPKLDIDAMGVDSLNEKAILIQLRSRDDTGGTTAKGSLVDMLRALLRTNKIPQNDILYLVCVWDARDSQQKKSTVAKMFSALRDLIETSEDEFYHVVDGKIDLRERISLQMVYGTDEIANSLFEWIAASDYEVLNSIATTVNIIEDWDDLWVSYAIASLELPLTSFSKYSNVKLLNEKWNQIGARFSFNSYEELTKSIDQATQKIIPLWTEDSIPLKSLSDKAHYIRDLLFLKACYARIS